MAYRIKKNERVEQAIQRIAREQIDQALAELKARESDDETVHQVRKRCKKLRGLIRLVRPALGDIYDAENTRYRDAARGLSGVRDVEAVVETFDKYCTNGNKSFSNEFASIRERLEQNRQRMTNEQCNLQESLSVFRRQMRQARMHVETWTLSQSGFAAVKGGWQNTYARGRIAMAAAYADPTTENFHEWRKRAKYHWYHHRLLVDLCKPVMKSRVAELSRLADLLGDDHDLSVLIATLTDDSRHYGEVSAIKHFITLARKRQTKLRKKSRLLGEYIYAESPQALTKRIKHYWQARRD